MSTQRICDLDGQAINPEVDEFFTVTEGRTGKTKDICRYCAHADEGPDGLKKWTANTALAVGDQVHPVDSNRFGGPTYYSLAWTVTVAGTTGSTQPTWPQTVGATKTDGSVTYKTELRPRGATSVYFALPGSPIPANGYSIAGWIGESWELAH